MNREQFTQELVAWINARLVPAGMTVTESTPLFEDGLIDSMRILQLIAWAERATGQRIPDEQMRMDYFRDVRSIAARFAEGKP